MTEPAPTALDLLKRTESLLSALHGSVARHDNLAANLGCAGCELRDQIRGALPTLAAAPSSAPADRPTPDFTSPLAGRIEVREPCPWCPDRPMVPHSLMDDHCARLHPDVQVVSAVDQTTRDCIAEALRPWVLDSGHGAEERAAADAVLAVLPPPVSRADVLREAADALPEADLPFVPPMDRRRVADWLRRLADETQQDGAQS